jgi:cell division protease FtsH
VNSNRFRHGFVYVLVIIALIVLFLYAQAQRPRPEVLTLSEVATAIEEGRVESISVTDDRLEITLTNGEVAISSKEPGTPAPEQLAALGVSEEEISSVQWDVQQRSDLANLLPMALMYGLPLIFIIGLLYFMLRQAQGSNNQAISFGKSRARLFTGDQPTVTFDDVAGADEATEELQEVVEFLKEPEKFIRLGARIPKGVLLVGPPGTGKTLLAKAVSGEAGVPFFSISGSEFVEMFVGVGASRVRDLFEQAKRHSPCIVFVDELDAVGRHRGAGLGGSHDEREQTLNQILVEMDGFDTDTNVIVLAATNRPDILDPALLRPGRFDRRVILDRPDIRGREGILKIHVRGKPLDNDVDLSVLARGTPGFVGADIENMVNEAAILAARQNKRSINLEDFQEAIERVVAGPERRSRLLTERERELTAYHEAGHAIVMHFLPNCDVVQKVTIIPRGMAGGYTLALPGEDQWYHSRGKFLDNIAGLLGGRVAEELAFDEITTGAASDIEQVTKMARAMVTRYGMSEMLGPMIFGQKEELVFLGREIGEQRDYSEAVAEEIDQEVRRIINEGHERASAVLSEHREELDHIAHALLEQETLERAEFLRLLGEKPDKEPSTPKKAPGRALVNDEEGERGEETPPALDLPPAPAPI